MNAFTGQEVTAFYVRVPDQHLALALDILSDIVWSPALRADEVESERQVILEEIRMRDDTPDDLVHDVFAGALFPGHPLGREVAGTQETITAMTRDADRRVPRRRTTSRRTSWSRWPATSTTTTWSAHGRARAADRGRAPRPTASAAPTPRDSDRVRGASSVRSSRRTSCSACAALRRDDPDRFALGVLDQVLGGGMSSRLFQEVREQRGLAYSVFSYRSAFEETGALAVYCGTAPERVDEIARRRARRARPPGRRRRRHRARARPAPRVTSPVRWRCRSRARRAACTASVAAELTLGEIPTLDEVVAQVDAVTADDVAPGDRPRARATGARTLARRSGPAIRSPRV